MLRLGCVLQSESINLVSEVLLSRALLPTERSDEESLFIPRLFLPLILCRVFFLLSFCHVLLAPKRTKRPGTRKNQSTSFLLSTPPLPQPVRHQFHRCCARLIAGGVVDLEIQELHAISFSRAILATPILTAACRVLRNSLCAAI